MIEISQQEFENCIKDLINKKITRVELAKKLETDIRTLINKIYGINNIELLEQYIKIYPYRPKENKNIDYEALIIELLKHECTVKEIQEKYGISERTYRRNVKKLEVSNNELYLVYKDYLRNALSNDDLEYIGTLEEEPVKFSDCVEDRKAELMYFFMRYKELLDTGLTEKQAQNELKTTSKEIKRKSDELERIIKEEKMTRTNKQNSYKESLKVEGIKPIKVEENIQTEETEKIVGEGRTD